MYYFFAIFKLHNFFIFIFFACLRAAQSPTQENEMKKLRQNCIYGWISVEMMLLEWEFIGIFLSEEWIISLFIISFINQESTLIYNLIYQQRPSPSFLYLQLRHYFFSPPPPNCCCCCFYCCIFFFFDF